MSKWLHEPASAIIETNSPLNWGVSFGGRRESHTGGSHQGIPLKRVGYTFESMGDDRIDLILSALGRIQDRLRLFDERIKRIEREVLNTDPPPTQQEVSMLRDSLIEVRGVVSAMCDITLKAHPVPLPEPAGFPTMLEDF